VAGRFQVSIELLVVGGWWLVVGGWWLVVGGWWLVVGGWWLVVGGRWLVVHSKGAVGAALRNGPLAEWRAVWVPRHGAKRSGVRRGAGIGLGREHSQPLSPVGTIEFSPPIYCWAWASVRGESRRDD
jgi:hypothetical protein